MLLFVGGGAVLLLLFFDIYDYFLFFFVYIEIKQVQAIFIYFILFKINFKYSGIPDYICKKFKK
jgi:hypothetical protein